MVAANARLMQPFGVTHIAHGTIAAFGVGAGRMILSQDQNNETIFTPNCGPPLGVNGAFEWKTPRKWVSDCTDAETLNWFRNSTNTCNNNQVNRLGLICCAVADGDRGQTFYQNLADCSNMTVMACTSYVYIDADVYTAGIKRGQVRSYRFATEQGSQ